MNCHFNLVNDIANRVCRFNRCSGLFDDLCQIGELTVNRLSHKSNSYIAKAVRHAMLKAIPKRQPESLRDCDFPAINNVELSIDFYISELNIPTKERQIFIDYYINNISIDKIAKNNNMSSSSIYRILSKIKKEFTNVL